MSYSKLIDKVNHFSILNEGDSPLLIPDIKKITELISGDIGIAEKILSPVFESVKGLSDIEFKMPEDSGLKAIEKTIVSTMMDSYKPVMEFAKLFVEILAIAEHAVCMNTAYSVKLKDKTIGIPCRKPQYWDKSLNFALESFTSKTTEMEKLMDIKKISKDPTIINMDSDSYYIGYFDEKGNNINPPKWIKDSGKWFKNDVVSAPFKQLSPDLYKGVSQIREPYDKQLKSMKSSQDDLGIMNGLTLTLEDIINGTNKSGSNYIDDSDKSKGVNPPSILSEWNTKIKSSQLRLKYYPEQISTAQQLVDKKGEAKSPYVYVPSVLVNYNGIFSKVEVPLAFENQISKVETLESTYYDKVRRYTLAQDKSKRRYSLKNEVSSIGLFTGTDMDIPYFEKSITHFSHKLGNDYIPDNIKNYYMPYEWEEVFEYEIIDKSTKQVLGKETEKVQFKIDIENDYDLRIIKVINTPLDIIEVEGDVYTYISDEFKKGNIQVNENGTIFATNNTIPKKNKSVDSINDLNEGIVYQGIDPRYIDKKVFWLVEAVKKPDIKTNDKGVKNPFDSDKTDLNYNLLDKYKALSLIITKLLPIITTDLVPVIVDFISLVTNPTKIKDYLLDIGLRDEKLSKFPQMFPLFSKKSLDKTKKYKDKDAPNKVDDSPRQDKDYIYDGVQVKDDAKVISMFDGSATMEFGKDIFNNPIKININLEFGEFNDKETDKEQPIFKMIMDMVKLPFEIIFKIFKWLIDWIKKLLNPVKIADAVKEFLTFEWLKEILGKDSILSILGISIPSIEAIKEFMKYSSGEQAQNNYDDNLKSFKGKEEKILEVFVYDLLLNGNKIGQETEEKLITKPIKDQENKTKIKALLGDVEYSPSDLAALYLMPLKQSLGFLTVIQELINGFLSIPESIFGLSPTIELPKFGKEIPFADILEKIIEELEQNTKRIIT